MRVPLSLEPEQKQAISEYLKPFKDYLRTSDGSREFDSRKKRLEFYKGLTPKKLETLDEITFEKIIGGLWASQFWGNKRYLIQKLLTDNGIEKLGKELNILLHGEKPPEVRYSDFLKRVKGLGPASVTELLCYTDPRQCAIWNDKARKGLELLKFGETLPLQKYQISTEEYKMFNSAVRAIAEELWVKGFEEIKDLALVGADLFLYAVWRHHRKEPEDDEKFDHDEICNYLSDIGTWLGFEVDTERTVAHGARVDVIWRSAIGNLGVVTYVFEVQIHGNIDSLILNLQKSLSNPTVQKVVAVSDHQQLQKLEKEIEGLPENFRRCLVLWQARDVKEAYGHLSRATEIINKLGLVEDSFTAS
jgi:hypothetical protein